MINPVRRYSGLRFLRLVGFGIVVLFLQIPTIALASPSGQADPVSSVSGHQVEPRRTITFSDKRILFIGNSYTYYAKLPQFFQELIAQGDRHPVVEYQAGPGMSLSDHLADPETMKLIDGGNWDIIIFQDHSLATIESPLNFFSVGQAIITRAKKAGAQVLLFETWARKSGHDYYQAENTKRMRRNSKTQMIGGPKVMQRSISFAYAKLAKRSGVNVIHIGQAMTMAAGLEPNLRVFDDDGSHPSLLGAQLAAMVVYSELTKRCPPSVAGSLLGSAAVVPSMFQRIVGQVVGLDCH